jgi:hypothetical protein
MLRSYYTVLSITRVNIKNSIFFRYYIILKNNIIRAKHPWIYFFNFYSNRKKWICMAKMTILGIFLNCTDRLKRKPNPDILYLRQ